jgi:hypothetical protein
MKQIRFLYVKPNSFTPENNKYNNLLKKKKNDKFRQITPVQKQ